MSRPLTLLGALALAGCAHAQQPAPAVDGAVVTLERTACYGSCPIYSVRLSDDGTVRFVGERNVTMVGTAEGTVKPKRVRALARRFGAADYWKLADRYMPGEANCPRYAADLPTVITSITIAGKTKRVEHDHGCAGVPPALLALEMAVDSVGKTARWTGVTR